MLWVPQKGDVLVQHNLGSVGSATLGTSVSTGAGSSTKGTAVQIFASTNFDAYWVTVYASNYAEPSTICEGAMDILIGAATEEVIIPNLLMGHCGGMSSQGNGPKRWDFPLYIPAGSRIAAQAAGQRLSTPVFVGIELRGGYGYPPWRVGGKVVTYGMGTVPSGTSITPGATGAEGSWTQVTASTTEDHFAVACSFQAATDTSLGNNIHVVDIGTGSATEEQIAESLWFGTDVTESFGGPYNSCPIFKEIPSGTRLAMRVSNDGANDAAYNCAIHCVS